GPLYMVSAWILAHALEHGLDVLDLDAEMVEPGRPARLARIDVEADIAVAHRDRPVGAGSLRRAHPEQRLVEGGEQGIALADNGNVVDLGEQGRPSGSLAESLLHLIDRQCRMPRGGRLVSRAQRSAAKASKNARRR